MSEQNDLGRRIAEIDVRRAEIGAEERRLKSERAELEEKLLEILLKEGVGRFVINGRTVYIRKQEWLGAPLDDEGKPNVDAAVAILKDVAPHLVAEKYNSQSASAWMRELPRDEETNEIIWPEGAEALRVTEQVDIRSRAAS